jgi:hypothetical protein
MDLPTNLPLKMQQGVTKGNNLTAAGLQAELASSGGLKMAFRGD